MGIPGFNARIWLDNSYEPTITLKFTIYQSNNYINNAIRLLSSHELGTRSDAIFGLTSADRGSGAGAYT